MRIPFLRLLPLALFAACSHSHPLDGAWNEERADGAEGMSVSFETNGTKCLVHGAPRPDGGHDHFDGTYTFDAATKAVTIKVKLVADGKEESLTGKIDGEHLNVSSADGKLKLAFHHGAGAHGH